MPEFETLITEIFKYIGGFVATSGTLLAVFYGLFKLFGEKLIENKFKKSIEEFRHQQQQELEHLRFQINAQLDRVTKLHQHEFEALPEAWSLMADAYYKTAAVTSSFQSYPDFNTISGPELEQFITDCKLEEWQKQELRHTTDKTRYFMKHIDSQRLAEAHEAAWKARTYILKSGIFMQRPIVEKFQNIDDLIYAALIERQTNQELDGVLPRKIDDQAVLAKRGVPLLRELETIIHERLWARLTEEKRPSPS
jgi:hypothetical protein